MPSLNVISHTRVTLENCITNLFDRPISDTLEDLGQLVKQLKQVERTRAAKVRKQRRSTKA